MRLILNSTPHTCKSFHSIPFDADLTGKSAFTGVICIASSPVTRTGYIRTRMIRRGFLQRGLLFSTALAHFTHTRPPRCVQVESRRAWILAHRFFRHFADELVIFEVLSNRIVDKRPVSPEPPGRLVRNRGAREPDGFGIPPLPPGVVVDGVQLVRARAQAGESLAGTHHSLSGASWLSFLRAHEETENRKQPATRERRAVLNGWEVATGELGALEREKHGRAPLPARTFASQQAARGRRDKQRREVANRACNS